VSVVRNGWPATRDEPSLGHGYHHFLSKETFMSAKTMYVVLFAILATQARTAGAQTVPATPPRSTAETPIPAAGTFIVPSRSKAKGFTGISYSGEVSLDASDEAIWADFPVVAAVAPGSPGAMAGVKVGDAILSVNGADGRHRATARDAL